MYVSKNSLPHIIEQRFIWGRIMTEEYKVELFSRIEKLSRENVRTAKRYFFFFLFCIAFATAGFFIGKHSDGGTVAVGLTKAHFCSFFDSADFAEKVRSIVSFSFPDMLFILAISALGYVMLRGAALLPLSVLSARLGVCLSLLYGTLVESPVIENGKTAFILFVSCKTIVLLAASAAALKSESFSYTYGSLFTRYRAPFSSEESKYYIKFSLSAAGTSVLVNVIYIFFMVIQKYKPI